MPFISDYIEVILTTTCKEQAICQTDIEIFQSDELRNLSISAYPLGSPQPHSVVIRIEDTTDRKQLEQSLVQSEKMLSVGGLAAGVAHEVNNPLAAIMQSLQLIQMRLSAENPKSRQLAEQSQLDLGTLQNFLSASRVPERLEHAMVSCNRAATIVKNMLNFSRSGKSDFTATNLAELIDNTLNLLVSDHDLQRKYDFKQVRIERNFAEGIPEVICEASKIQQVVFNLLKNGAEAMALGDIPIKKRRFEVDIFCENNMAVIRITDSGPGMSEAVRKRIFEPFFTTKAVGTGTGLGLFVAYFIITENHNGDISVESTPGQGTRFTIKLPLTQTTA